ncbi:3-ketoacyl-CoA thiolase, mitochondrial-like [Battus philenor]|uniref:3-ketoacyl-CoA thiolase, mitochondrial-like n=1 Tax=Battus philenor TaxID=42288 RepID=UPI0035CEB43E
MALKCKGIFVVGAKRTPFCRYGGSLRNMQASHIFATAAKEAICSANLKPDVIDNTVVGNVNFLSQCDGGKTPRYCGIYSGVPIERPALGVNKACGSGLQAIITASVDILTGSAKVCLVGGTELMSSIPHLVRNIRFGTTLGVKYQMEDPIKQLQDSYCGMTMEQIAERIAKRFKLTREDVDKFTLDSHKKWELAQETKIFDAEIAPVTINLENEMVYNDEARSYLNIRDQNNYSIITSENSAVPADGAAALILADEESVNKHQLVPLARISGWACVGVDPAYTGLGAISAVHKLLTVTEKKIENIDLFEVDETFASHSLAVIKELNIDPNKVNVSGGALALGHPVAATGARMATHLTHQIRRNNARTTIATSNCGAGQGIAVMLESI